jgi:hypothetical protein
MQAARNDSQANCLIIRMSACATHDVSTQEKNKVRQGISMTAEITFCWLIPGRKHELAGNNAHPKATRRGHIDLATLLALIAVMTGSRPTLTRRLQRAAIESPRWADGPPAAALCNPFDRTQFAHHGIETTRLKSDRHLETNATYGPVPPPFDFMPAMPE